MSRIGRGLVGIACATAMLPAGGGERAATVSTPALRPPRPPRPADTATGQARQARQGSTRAVHGRGHARPSQRGDRHQSGDPHQRRRCGRTSEGRWSWCTRSSAGGWFDPSACGWRARGAAPTATSQCASLPRGRARCSSPPSTRPTRSSSGSVAHTASGAPCRRRLRLDRPVRTADPEPPRAAALLHPADWRL